MPRAQSRSDKPKSRRPRGTGTIFKRVRDDREVWVARVPTGGRTRGGHTKYQEISDPSQAKLVERLKALSPPGPDTTLAEWSERWLAGFRGRASTRDAYRYTALNYIVPTLGHLRVSALTHTHVEGAVRQWLAELGPGTVRLYLVQLRACLSAARRAGLVSTNAASDVKPPKIPRRTIEPIPPADLRRVIAAATLRRDGWPVALLAATGCRIGEALALEVGDYDPASGRLSIDKTWTRQHGIRPPKSENGIRTIRVPESARAALERSIGGRRTGPIFTAFNERDRRRPESVREAFYAILKRLDLPRCTPHKLRHSVASLLVSSGESLADCAAFLGDSVGVVISTYLHPSKRDPSLVMDRLLSPEKRRRG